MKRVASICLVVVTACMLAGTSTQAQDESSQRRGEFHRYQQGEVYSPNAFRVQYLGVDGAFTLDTKEISATDPRNPRRVAFQQMEFFSFYKDYNGNTPIAKNCQYVYKGADGDPFYYPKQSKTSIWDLFELASGDAACNNFYYVIMRSPHGNPVHMHMRYGNAKSSFHQLLNLSNAPENKNSINPWWSVYCAAGVSGCD